MEDSGCSVANEKEASSCKRVFCACCSRSKCKRNCVCRLARRPCGPHCACNIKKCENRGHSDNDGDVAAAPPVSSRSADLAKSSPRRIALPPGVKAVPPRRCDCGRRSKCKRTCVCRLAGRPCGPHCACNVKKCENRSDLDNDSDVAAAGPPVSSAVPAASSAPGSESDGTTDLIMNMAKLASSLGSTSCTRTRTPRAIPTGAGVDPLAAALFASDEDESGISSEASSEASSDDGSDGDGDSESDGTHSASGSPRRIALPAAPDVAVPPRAERAPAVAAAVNDCAPLLSSDSDGDDVAASSSSDAQEPAGSCPLHFFGLPSLAKFLLVCQTECSRQCFTASVQANARHKHSCIRICVCSQKFFQRCRHYCQRN